MTLQLPKFVLARADDWEALYADGECVEQAHEIDIIPWLRKFGVRIEGRAAYNHPDLDDVGCFPDKLDEVVFDK